MDMMMKKQNNTTTKPLNQNKMTPKEKAEELVDKFRMNVLDYEGSGLNTFKAKQCALIAVDEIIKTLKDNDLYIGGETNIDDIIRFWQEVKQEIENL